MKNQSGRNLSKRINWQTISGAKALGAEALFKNAFEKLFEEVEEYKDFQVIDKPTHFKNIYSTHELEPDVLRQIYNVDVSEKRKTGKPKYEWGIEMDFAIFNKKSGKTLFVEVKRQDGWIEGGIPSDGRGNAHERGTKYFTPGLKEIITKESKIFTNEILPFWLVFQGNITRDPKRNREISFWFDGYPNNFFMWRYENQDEVEPQLNPRDLVEHFEEYLLPYLL